MIKEQDIESWAEELVDNAIKQGKIKDKVIDYLSKDQSELPVRMAYIEEALELTINDVENKKI